MLKKINEAVTRFGLFNNSKNVTVALSGGADSMALLCALVALKNELNIQKISAAHFNHQIRGDEALRDQNFVIQQCKKFGVELYIGSADVPAFAKDNGLSIELAARKLRYEFFDSLDTDVIATAHTASDNIETVLFNLTRGTALSGLCGIPPKRDRYVRPLIFCTREDIEHYCEQNGIEFVTDSTNLSDEYTRNNIRHNVIPILKQVNQSVENTVNRMTVSLREDDDYITMVANKEFDDRKRDDILSLSDFYLIHPAVAKRIIIKYCASFGVEVDSFHTNAIYNICLSGGKTSLPQNRVAIVSDNSLQIKSASELPQLVEFRVNINRRDNDLFQKNKKIHNLLLKNVLDCDRIVGQLSLRVRKSGDTIRLKNKNCTKTLKKLYCEYKIPLVERETLPVLVDDEGVVWIHKIGVAERVAADENSNHIYTIDVQKNL